MKHKRHSVITHAHKGYFHFWLIPSIEVDFEHLKNEKYGEYRWLHLCFSWLIWGFDIEWEG